MIAQTDDRMVISRAVYDRLRDLVILFAQDAGEARMKAHSGDLMRKGDQALSPRLIYDGEPPNPRPWPDPTPEMLQLPEFEAIWQCIKRWDINVPDAYAGYCGANGNHVRAILDALSPDVTGEWDDDHAKVS